MAALNVVYDRLRQLGLNRFCLEAHSTKAGKAKIIEELKGTLAAVGDDGKDLSDEHLEDLVRVRDELNAYVRELHERREPLALSIYQVIGKVEKLHSETDLRAPLPWDDPLKVTRAKLNAAIETLADLGVQASVFDSRESHPWRGLAIDPGRPLRRDVIEADLLTIRESLQKLQAHVAGLEVLLGSTAPVLTLETLNAFAPALLELTKVDGLPPAWATR